MTHVSDIDVQDFVVWGLAHRGADRFFVTLSEKRPEWVHVFSDTAIPLPESQWLALLAERDTLRAQRYQSGRRTRA